MKIFRIFKEFNNYFFLLKTVKKNKNTAEWKKHNLRTGYFGIIYTLINLPPEVYESEEQYYQMYVIEQMKPINEYLSTLNLHEIISVNVENKCDKENGEYAFGVIYSPLFREFSLWWLFKWTSIIGGSAYVITKFNLVEYVERFLKWANLI